MEYIFIVKNTRLLNLEIVDLDLSSELSSQCTNVCECSVSYHYCSISERTEFILCNCMCFRALLGSQYPFKFTGFLLLRISLRSIKISHRCSFIPKIVSQDMKVSNNM